jgi:DNA invertase Pin-like site-specific DNA recombinase
MIGRQSCSCLAPTDREAAINGLAHLVAPFNHRQNEQLYRLEFYPMEQSVQGTAGGTPKAPLRVVVIGRVSTIHQSEENIEASYRYVDDHLHRLNLGPVQIQHLGEQASGMLAERQTIRQTEDLMAAGKVDLVVAEGLSRIFRNPRHQLNFVQDAVDAGVRVLCLADNLDTASDNWELMLGAAGLRHGLFVSDTRRRVRRTATHAFHNGGMVLRVHYGYRKLTKVQAASGEFGPPGLHIAKDHACTPVIREMREMVLAGRSLAQVAYWLNSRSIRPGPYVSQPRWNSKLLGDYLRAPILHGERTFRTVIYQPVLRTGKHRREPNRTPERKTYQELAHLSAEEHAELCEVLDRRASSRRQGTRHPRLHVPRARAIWPAQHLRCHICGGLMYAYDRGRFKCSNALPGNAEPCWNSCASQRRLGA